MANKTLSTLSAGTAPDGTEIIYVVQGGESVRLTASQIVSALGLLASNNLSDVANAVTARTNLGLLSAALRNAEDTLTNGSNLPDGAAVTAAIAAVPSPVKAWVNFNGTGTPEIREDFNVSSITDLGIGRYRVNFTSNMISADYAVSVTANLSLAQRILTDAEAGIPALAVDGVAVGVRGTNNFGDADQVGVIVVR